MVDRTEKAYIHWIKRFIFFHNKRHPSEMGFSCHQPLY
ncbi:MAG: phage integrase N-terminal SAM-like domain-containing protein [Candidatus Binatota bacterium]